MIIYMHFPSPEYASYDMTRLLRDMDLIPTPKWRYVHQNIHACCRYGRAMYDVLTVMERPSPSVS